MAEPTIPFEAVAALRAEIHRVFCGGAKHRGRFTGMCSTGAPANVLRGLAANPDAARKVAATLLTEEALAEAIDDHDDCCSRMAIPECAPRILAALRSDRNPTPPEALA